MLRKMRKSDDPLPSSGQTIVGSLSFWIGKNCMDSICAHQNVKAATTFRPFCKIKIIHILKKGVHLTHFFQGDFLGNIYTCRRLKPHFMEDISIKTSHEPFILLSKKKKNDHQYLYLNPFILNMMRLKILYNRTFFPCKTFNHIFLIFFKGFGLQGVTRSDSLPSHM